MTTPGGYGPPPGGGGGYPGMPGGGAPPGGPPSGGYPPGGGYPPAAPPGGGYPPAAPPGGGYPPPQAPMGGAYGPPGGPMGGPPGFGAPQKKSGPPVALMVGGGCGLLAVIGVIVLVIALASGGSEASASEDDDKPTSGDDKPSSGDDGVANAMDGAQYKRIPSTNVEIPVPPGWREDRRSLYSFALSGDGDAILAFTTVSSLGEFAGRIQHATKVFSITDCTMKDAVRVNIGPNKLRSRLKEGVCTFNGVRANVATVLVESGRRAHPLVIYAVDVSASKVTVEQAQQTVLRMRNN